MSYGSYSTLTYFNLPAAVTLTMKKRAGSRNIDLMAASENFGTL